MSVGNNKYVYKYILQKWEHIRETDPIIKELIETDKLHFYEECFMEKQPHPKASYLITPYTKNENIDREIFKHILLLDLFINKNNKIVYFGWFWSMEYKHSLRDVNYKIQLAVLNEFLKNKLKPEGVSAKHYDIVKKRCAKYIVYGPFWNKEYNNYFSNVDKKVQGTILSELLKKKLKPKDVSEKHKEIIERLISKYS